MKAHSEKRGVPPASSKAAAVSLILAACYAAAAIVFAVSALTAKHMAYGLPFVAYGGTFKFPSVMIGQTKVSLYWLMHGVGTAGMVLMCLGRRRRFGISVFVSVITGILLAVLGYVGAKILYTLENLPEVAQEGITVGGVSFFGTVFFMPLILPLLALCFRVKAADYINYVTPAGLLMLIAIRTGCFFNGCCKGIQLWAGSRPLILPAQLIECVLDLCLMACLFITEKKSKAPLYPVFIGGYGLLRFFLEFIRATDKGLLGLSNGQWLGLLAVIISAIWLYVDCRRRSKAK